MRLSDLHVGKTKPELVAQRDFSESVIRFFDEHGWMVAARHDDCWSHVPWSHTCDQARRQMQLQRWLLGLAQTRLARLAAPLGHLAGWTCIHDGEGAWSSDTGNRYYGGLQMTYGWAGRVGNAALLSPAAQIAAAEAEASTHGWSYSWMASQWPETFPPCARYFAGAAV